MRVDDAYLGKWVWGQIVGYFMMSLFIKCVHYGLYISYAFPMKKSHVYCMQRTNTHFSQFSHYYINIPLYCILIDNPRTSNERKENARHFFHMYISIGENTTMLT